MANIKINFKVRKDFLNGLEPLILERYGRKARGNFADLRPIVAEGVDEGVQATKEQFIPSDDQAYQLGVGANGTIDAERTQGAYKQLFVENGITKISVKKSGSKANLRSFKLGTINVNISEEAFFNAALSVVSTAGSAPGQGRATGQIPWMRWLIRGAPLNTEYFFSDKAPIPQTSRTGGGVMRLGGTWDFPPAKPAAFEALRIAIGREVARALRRDGGKVL